MTGLVDPERSNQYEYEQVRPFPCRPMTAAEIRSYREYSSNVVFWMGVAVDVGVTFVPIGGAVWRVIRVGDRIASATRVADDIASTPPGVPAGYSRESANNLNGTVWRPPGSTGNANTIRIMGPKPGYPNGYVVYYNKYGQPVNLSGKPGSMDETHIPIRVDGFYGVPVGW